jgi:hypothetical protein
VNKGPISTESFSLHMQWIDQFVRESEQALAMNQDNIRAAAQTVLFYAGMHVQIQRPIQQETDAVYDWLLAPEEEVVEAAVELVPPSLQRLLRLSLQAVADMEREASSLTAKDKDYIRAQAGAYICRVREQVNQLAVRWLH